MGSGSGMGPGLRCGAEWMESRAGITRLPGINKNLVAVSYILIHSLKLEAGSEWERESSSS